MEPLLKGLLRSLGGSEANFLEVASEGFRLETSTPRQLLRSLGPLPETSAWTPPNFREVPPGAFPVMREAGWKIILKSLMSVIFCPQFWGQKWLRQFLWALAFLGSFCWKTPMAIKIRGEGWKGGTSANIIWWEWGFFRVAVEDAVENRGLYRACVSRLFKGS